MAPSQAITHFAVIDFEAQCQKGPRLTPQEIIEWPCVLVDASTGETVDEFHSYVRPLAHPRLTAFCTELTGIEQATVDAAPPFADVLSAFTAWASGHAAQGRRLLPVTCGDWDLRTCLPGQVKYSGLSHLVPPILGTWCNVKNAFRDAYGDKARGMAGMLRHLKLPLVGRHHSGIDDSRNIAAIVRKLLADGHVVGATGFTSKHGPGRAAPSAAVPSADATVPKFQRAGSRVSGLAGGGRRTAAKVGQNPAAPAAAATASAPVPSAAASPLPVCDIGINLTNPAFSRDLNDVLKRAQAANVTKMIITGTCLKSSRSAVRLAGQHPGLLFASVGVHPHSAKEWREDTAAKLKALAAEARGGVVFAGEMGLDFDRMFSPRDVQENAFRAQIRMADELDLPLFLHVRGDGADEAFHAILSEFEAVVRRVGGVVHCFTGTTEWALRYLDLGLDIGITGWVTQKRGADLVETVRRLPRDRLHIETDGPFLMPHNVPREIKKQRGKPRCEPAMLPYVVDKIAEIWDCEPADVARHSWANTHRLVRI